SGGLTRLDSTSWTVSAGQRSTRAVMSPAAPAAARWKSSTTIAAPAGSFAASLMRDAVTSADKALPLASRSAASAPNPGSTTRVGSMNPAQSRTGSASAPSQDSQDVSPAGRAAAQYASSTLLPAPAGPTTTVRRAPAPAVSRARSPGRLTSVAGNAGGRSFAVAIRVPSPVPTPVTADIPPDNHGQ